VYHEEQFGPVIPVVPYDDVNLPLRYIIESKYGQQASIFGRDRLMMARLVDVLAHQVSRININCKCQRTPDTFPFTGRKDSAEGVLSVSDALHAFTVPVFIAARETEQDKTMLMEITDLVDYKAQKAKV
jgi:glyceraldehyde-3-phosphate dehydrogenase (NADP+)